jgi:pyrroloquinoline quinone biosynthesis protein D
VIARGRRPRLAAKARLRFDPPSQQHMLVYPERGMLLNATATEVVQLCTGERSVDEIIAALQLRYSAALPEQVEREVIAMIEALVERGLIAEEP